MNEKLKELMLEAGYAAPEIALRAQKLAELIVKECVHISRDYGSSAKYSYTPSKAIVAERTAEGCATLIEANFGVK